MKRIIFVLLSLLLLSLAACGAEEGAKPAGSARDPYEDYNNRFMVRGAPEGPLQWVETEDYYFIGYKYYDKKTEECEFYCARPDCMHEDETCDACKGVLGIYGGKLYFIAAIDKNHSGIFTQNLDGTERKLVRPFTDDEQLQQGKVYFHRGILYCFLNESYIDNGAPKSHLRLMAIDPNKDDSRVLFE
ncbi:MAG: hypothetical protein IKX58_02855, partial [Clostridia bacterium]|nr:hypothetical protein [Clostridia bacterium]